MCVCVCLRARWPRSRTLSPRARSNVAARSLTGVPLSGFVLPSRAGWLAAHPARSGAMVCRKLTTLCKTAGKGPTPGPSPPAPPGPAGDPCAKKRETHSRCAQRRAPLGHLCLLFPNAPVHVFHPSSAPPTPTRREPAAHHIITLSLHAPRPRLSLTRSLSRSLALAVSLTLAHSRACALLRSRPLAHSLNHTRTHARTHRAPPAAVAADGCLPGSTAACEACAKSHRADLNKAGCTTQKVVELCKGACRPASCNVGSLRRGVLGRPGAPGRGVRVAVIRLASQSVCAKDSVIPYLRWVAPLSRWAVPRPLTTGYASRAVGNFATMGVRSISSARLHVRCVHTPMGRTCR